MHRGSFSNGKLVLHVFLDRNPRLKGIVMSQVDNPKAARAQHLDNAIAVRLITDRQSVLVVKLYQIASPFFEPEKSATC